MSIEGEINLHAIEPAAECFVVAGLLTMPDGRYLMQLRDDRPDVAIPGHWALFGGGVEPGEQPGDAIRREIEEELAYQSARAAWYHETIMVLPRCHRRIVRKAFYVIPITADDVATMILGEGADMALFTPEELCALPNVAPWDLSVVLMHAREAQLFPYR